MFTGLIEEIGRIRDVETIGSGAHFIIAAPQIAAALTLGESVAVDGVCLTVVQQSGDAFCVEAVAETLRRSTLSRRRAGEAVNLERALQWQSRLGGHFVQGHVDGIGEVISLTERQPGYWLQVALAPELMRFVVEKGSIAIDGVSLTVAEMNDRSIAVALIPYTAQRTTLASKKIGDAVNIEVDILSKYVHRLLQNSRAANGLSPEKLRQWGYE